MIREGTRTSLRPHVYNKNEAGWPWKTAQWTWHPTIRGWYFGTLFKGWWKFGAGSINRHFEIEFAIGGEDNMLQAGIVVPFLFRWHIGARVPRRLTKGWIYERREWTVKIGYIGHWLELLFASDEHMRDTGMVSYYRAKRERGADSHTTRVQEWPGWHLTIAPHPLDKLLGRVVCETTKGPEEPVEVPMPEGNYTGKLRREERVWKRPRWPWIKARRVDYWIDLDEGIPHAGKGENSWDCGDDAVMGTGGPTKAEAIANVTRAALRNRERYGMASQ